MSRMSLVAVLALGLTGCALNRGPERMPDGGEADQVEIQVKNHNFADATLHALKGGERIRLGIVTGKTDKSFRIPWRFTVPLRIEIDLLAGPACVTRSMQVDPGDIVEVQIRAVLTSDPDCLPLR